MKLFAKIVLIAGAWLMAADVRGQSGPDIVWATNAHFLQINSVSFSADGLRLASGGRDRHGKVWSVPGGTQLCDVFAVDRILSTALSSDGAFLATGDDAGRIKKWRVSDGLRQWQNAENDSYVLSVAFSPNGSNVAHAYLGAWVIMHDAETGAGTILAGHNDIVNSVAFSPDGYWLASASADDTVLLWNISMASYVQIYSGHSNDVFSVVFSPDGTLLATSSADATVRLWNVTNGVCVRVFDIGGNSNVKFSADGKHLFTLVDGTFKIWRAASGACVGSITNSGAVTFDLSKNGKYLAYGHYDYSVVLARTPLVLDEITRNGNETVLRWQGGSGLYQLQSSTNLAVNAWQNLGSPTTNTLATNVSSATQFFRVQSLPNP